MNARYCATHHHDGFLQPCWSFHMQPIALSPQTTRATQFVLLYKCIKNSLASIWVYADWKYVRAQARASVWKRLQRRDAVKLINVQNPLNHRQNAPNIRKQTHFVLCAAPSYLLQSSTRLFCYLLQSSFAHTIHNNSPRFVHSAKQHSGISCDMLTLYTLGIQQRYMPFDVRREAESVFYCVIVLGNISQCVM